MESHHFTVCMWQRVSLSLLPKTWQWKKKTKKQKKKTKKPGHMQMRFEHGGGIQS